MPVNDFTDPAGPTDSNLLIQQCQHRSWNIRSGDDGTLLCRSRSQCLIRPNDASFDRRITPYLQRAGLYHFATVPHIRLDHHLITALVERWRPETHTFHLPFGEATITLQDVAVLYGLRVDGTAVVDRTKFSLTELCSSLLGVVPDAGAWNGASLKISWLEENFPQPAPDADEDSIIRYARAYMLQLIGGTMFMNTSNHRVHICFLYLLHDFDIAGQYSWGSATLAWLYRSLCQASHSSAKQMGGLTLLVQLWAWERIPRYAPRRRGDLLMDDLLRPLAASWRFKYSSTHAPTNVISWYRFDLDLLQPTEFVWLPYIESRLQALPEICTSGREQWSIIAPLIVFDVVEWHRPDRVCRQFSLFQDVPSVTPNPIFLEELRGDPHTIKMLHRNGRGWQGIHAELVTTWNRGVHARVGGPFVDPYRGVSPDYLAWYRRVTIPYLSSVGRYALQRGVALESLRSMPTNLTEAEFIERIRAQADYIEEAWKSVHRGVCMDAPLYHPTPDVPPSPARLQNTIAPATESTCGAVGVTSGVTSGGTSGRAPITGGHFDAVV